MFCLTFCIAKKEDYAEKISPDIQRIKFKYWGHDSIILHEHEIRKEKGDFAVLRASKEMRLGFLSDLTGIVSRANISVIASVIKKQVLKERYSTPWSPYHISLHFCLERLFEFLAENGQQGKTVHVVFECRGKEEDDDLELEFRRIISGESAWGSKRTDFSRINFVPIFAKKVGNSAGLQLADLTARPLALGVLRPDQPNKALDIIRTKIYRWKSFP